ncbi:hypothetical protein N059_02883 [Mycobacterium tuberculosis variant africanum MAL010102]|nr:hypothetical protein N059_02883 [Mycobacterium tuberculosis variant africanum MAL010102]
MPWLRGVVRPKTPRGDGNNTSVARHTPTNHQVVRPKTPRGDGNFSDHLCGISGLRSSDPKPREGTETPMRRHFRLQFQPVVRPKTPRGDGNILSANSSTVPLSGRQTQNPERGRKRPVDGGCVVRASVVRPKTPRGDGNPTTSSGIQSHGYARSSDPKPREGTETCIHSSPTRRTSASRQTQNPERGRKLVIASRRAWRADCRQTQNPERGRKHHPTQAPKSMTSRRQTQNPERGRKLVRHLCLIQVQCPVVRPKTPRGDGNLTARSFPASIR